VVGISAYWCRLSFTANLILADFSLKCMPELQRIGTTITIDFQGTSNNQLKCGIAFDRKVHKGHNYPSYIDILIKMFPRNGF